MARLEINTVAFQKQSQSPARGEPLKRKLKYMQQQTGTARKRHHTQHIHTQGTEFIGAQRKGFLYETDADTFDTQGEFLQFCFALLLS